MIYLGALLMDMLCFIVGFAVFYGAGLRQMSSAQCAWIGAAVQLTYMPSSVIIGRILLRRNARVILIVGTAGTTGAGIGALFATHFVPILICLLFMGMFAAFFFNAFQTFMRSEAPPGGLTHAVANYTLAWSLGIALGFLLSGSAYRLGPMGLGLLTLLVGLVILAVVLLRQPRPEGLASAEEHIEHGPPGSPPVDSRYVLVGWIMIFAACFVQRPIQTFFPALCARECISPYWTSLPLFLMMIVQAVVGFLMKWFRPALYTRTALCVAQAMGAVALAVIWLIPRYNTYLAAFPFLGAYCGFAFFCAVYYASNDYRHRSFNVGVNEFLVGAGSLLGLFACEAWMRYICTDGALYSGCAAALIVFTLVQLAAASRIKRG